MFRYLAMCDDKWIITMKRYLAHTPEAYQYSVVSYAKQLSNAPATAIDTHNFNLMLPWTESMFQ